jgi:cell fate (sporulation/competence/biofilm development) regulator YlbF (YheA/YmcA/DUF963 family)
MNVYDTVNQLSKELRELPEYQTLKTELAKVKADPQANELFEKFQKSKKSLQENFMDDKTPNEAEQEEFYTLIEQVKSHPVLSQMLQKEQAFLIIMEDMVKTIQVPFNDLYK